MYQLFIKTLTGRTITVEIDEDATIEQLKELVWQQQNGSGPPSMHLVFCSKRLEDDKRIGDCGFGKVIRLHAFLNSPTLATLAGCPDLPNAAIP
jgi:hypothetical protein